MGGDSSVPIEDSGGSGMPSEKELDRAFETAIQQDEVFRAWFLSRTRHGPKYPELVLTNSRHPWGKVRVMLPDAETGALSFHDREGETDILLVFHRPLGRLGIHVENKTANRSFTPHQPEVYAARADRWRNSEKYGSYDTRETVLLAPQSVFTKHSVQASKFTTRIAYEDAAVFVPAFGA